MNISLKTFSVSAARKDENMDEDGSLRVVIDKGAADSVLTAGTPLNGVISWKITTKGQLVSVPVFPYILPGKFPGLLLACGFEYGMRAALQLYCPVKAAIVVVGDAVEETKSGLRAFIGVAFIAE